MITAHEAHEAAFKAEGAYKLAEIEALNAVNAAQHMTRLAEWSEVYGTDEAWMVRSAKADELDRIARGREDEAERLYKEWADLVR